MTIKVKKETFQPVEIGILDAALLLPMEERLALGIKTVCDVCRRDITDKFFIVGFKEGYKAMLFHEYCFNKDTDTKSFQDFTRKNK